MIETTFLPSNFIDGDFIQKATISKINEIQMLTIAPHTSIKKHKHDKQWEIYLRISPKQHADICLKGESHELVNNTDKQQIIIAIKGDNDYTLEDFKSFFHNTGFYLHHGSCFIHE